MFLTEEGVRSLLRMDELIPAMAEALRDLSSGKVQQPMRVVLPVTDHQGFFAVMPACAASSRALGAKVVTFYPNNQGVPTHHAMIFLFRPETGEPLVTMDGRLITEMRTAAVSAVATNLLARADASVLAILGSGVQARSHLEALRLVRNFREVRVWSPRNSSAFAEQFDVTAKTSAEEAVGGADVIVVATSATSPVLMGEWLSPGAHINAVGATRPNWRELDDVVMRRARIYVESREAAMKESGDIIAAAEIFAASPGSTRVPRAGDGVPPSRTFHNSDPQEIAENRGGIAGGEMVVEIGEVVAGSKTGRQSAEEITLFKSVGVAVEDIVAADLVYRRATDTDIPVPPNARQAAAQ